MPTLIKPNALRTGDRIACVSSSWGGPGTFPHRYGAGKRQLEAAFGVEVVEMPHTLAAPDFVADHPEARAADLMRAFKDPDIHGIVSSIGGDESIRILPWLDLDVIRHHPKPYLGYSDSTVTHFACFAAGIVSFYGPSVMSGFAENAGLFPYLEDAVRKTLFQTNAVGELEPNRDGWTVERLDWADPALQTKPRVRQPCTGWRFARGRGVYEGPLIGGCLESVNFLRGTAIWPAPERWSGAVLFLETSEEAPSPTLLARELRTYAAMGILERLSAILLGRPGGNVPLEAFEAYDDAVTQVLDEHGIDDIGVVTGMDFGHTDPMLVLPYGISARIDCDARTVSLTEPAVLPRPDSA